MKSKRSSILICNSLIVVGLLALASCKEKGPSINLTAATGYDTSYMAPVETAQPRRILIEEATGVKCSNCPAGVKIVESIEAQYPGRVIPVGIHGAALTDPFPFSTQNFRTPEADELMNTYFAEGPNKPAATIDRTQVGGKYFIDRSLWPATAATRIALPAQANITLSSSYAAVSNQATVRVHVAFLQPISQKLSLSLYLLENGIVDPQENLSAIDTFYVHNRVLRDIITPVSGQPFLDSLGTKAAGRVYEYNLVYTPDPARIPANCTLVAFIHASEPGNREVIQVASVSLK